MLDDRKKQILQAIIEEYINLVKIIAGKLYNYYASNIEYDDLISYGSELKVKEAGKARLEGKEYVMQDGDICYFRFNV